MNTDLNQTPSVPGWCQLVTNACELFLVEAAALTVAASVPIVVNAATGRPSVWGFPPLWVLWTTGLVVLAAMALLREWLRTFDPNLLPPGRFRRVWRVLSRTQRADNRPGTGSRPAPKSIPASPVPKALTPTVTGTVLYHRGVRL